MLDWILRHLGVVVFLVIFGSQILRAVLGARKNATEHQKAERGDPSARERRMKEVQEQIRRQIAERRGGRGTPPPPPVERKVEPRPAARPATTQLPEFGGPLGRMIEELQRRAQPQQQQRQPAAVEPPVITRSAHAAELERQQRLANDLKTLQENKVISQRRAANVAAEKKAAAQTESALLVESRGTMLRDLGDPQNLRRAFVLREVLGPPVGLR